MTTKARGYTCYVPGCTEPTPIGHMCEKHSIEHKARWKAEHTRHPGDKRRGWLIGDKCQVTLKGVTYEAKILDMSDTSRRENDYDLMKLELTKTVTGLDGKPYTSTWVHPEPVQSYKLKRALLRD